MFEDRIYINKGNDEYAVTLVVDGNMYTYIIQVKNRDEEHFKTLHIPCKSFKEKQEAFDDAINIINQRND